MRILIVGLNYRPESTSIGPYTADLAEYLSQRGHLVSVITGFPIAPYWRVWDGYRGSWFRRERLEGVDLLRTYMYVPKEPRRPIARILFDVSFTLSALVGSLWTGPADLVVVISPPLQLGLTGWVVSRLKGAPLFFHIQDLVPDAAVATGMLREGSFAVRIGKAIERLVYWKSKSLGVICEGFKANLAQKGVPNEKIVVLPNYIDTETMRPEARNGSFRALHGISGDAFLVMYSGSIGGKQGLEVLVDAAHLLREHESITFAMIGDGPSLPELKARAEQLGLRNLVFLSLQPREQLSEQLNAADVLVITQKRSVRDIVFPGKLLYYMAVGKPILAAVSVDSETGRFITQEGVGVITPPEQPEELAESVLRLRAANRSEMGTRGRTAARERFDRRAVLPAFAAHLEALTA